MGLTRGSLTLPRMSAHRPVIVAAALTMVVAAALGSALATFSGQARINARIFAQSVIQPQDDELMELLAFG